MNSFTVTAIGNIAKNPELVAKGDNVYTRFCLIGNDYAGKDEDGAAREVVTSLWFVAFGPLGEAIARNARKGDQLILDARIRANNWTDEQGERHEADAEDAQYRIGDERDEGTDHVDLAMSEIDYADDAVNHRVADGDEAIDRAQGESVDQLLEKIIHEPGRGDDASASVCRRPR